MKEVVSVLSCLLLSACSRAPTEGAGPVPPAPAAVAATSPAAGAGQDFKKPYLTEAKISGFLRSLQEEQKPAGLLSEGAADSAALARLSGSKSELDAFVRKFGFTDYEDYLAVWARILLAQSMVLAEQARDSSSNELEKFIADAEKKLQDTNLSSELRGLYEEQIARSKDTLERVRNSSQDLPLHAADFELVKAHRVEIEEEILKHKKP